ncbi:MAG: fumarylacetoacetase [Erythrobacter sp.]|nr:fumarylacetoacetase [Erythrobacter sp.]
MTIDLDFTHDPQARSWIEGPASHADFPVQNLPLGVFAPPDDPDRPRGGVAIGDYVLDLERLDEAGIVSPEARLALGLARRAPLNAFFADRAHARVLRRALFVLLTDERQQAKVRPCLRWRADMHMRLPFAVGDYTDFYTGIHHAENIGRLFRPDNPLLPNYKYVPIGYHGRASSIRASGVPVRRPMGQTRAPDAAEPVFGPCKRLDYELEMAIWVGEGNALGHPIAIGEAGRHVAGLSILNDWSARDMQAWEYQPLGPFLAKNFHSTVSPWVVTMDALAPFRVPQPARPAGDPAPLPYLLDAEDQAHGALDVQMEVWLSTVKMRAAGEAPHRLSSGPMTAMYWTMAQLVAHHASNGCDLQPGDLLGTGTLTSGAPGGEGSLMELTLGGKAAITLPNGEKRTFLEDGDEVVMTAFAQRHGYARIGFGECRGTVVG